MKRRAFLSRTLKSVVLFACFVKAPILNAKPNRATVKLGALSSFIDTIIPADTTPSASQLGLESKLVNHASKVKDYIPLLDLGCQWLDFQARTLRKVDFKLLGQEVQDRIVRMAEASPQGSIPRQFFDHVRADLFTFYYSHPSVWPSLGLYGSPQPLGYLNYVSSPKSKRPN